MVVCSKSIFIWYEEALLSKVKQLHSLMFAPSASVNMYSQRL